MRLPLLAAALAAAPLTLSAAPLTGDAVPLVFGDSQSDPGNAFLASLGTIPPATFYPNGQFTNGDTWAVQLGADVASGRNFAFGGAQAATDSDISPDFDAQIDAFLGFGPAPSAIETTIVFLGGNDLLGIDDPTEAPGVIADGVGAIGDGLGRLIAEGLTDFLVVGVPNISRAPRALAEAAALEAVTPGAGPQFLADLATVSVSFNAALGSVLAGLPAGVEAGYFDAFGFFEGINADPGSLGLTNLTEACIDVVAGTTCATPQTYAFHDDLHFSETLHTALAQAIAADLHPAPIPLPAGGWLLVASLGALVAARRRVAA